MMMNTSNNVRSAPVSRMHTTTTVNRRSAHHARSNSDVTVNNTPLDNNINTARRKSANESVAYSNNTDISGLESLTRHQQLTVMNELSNKLQSQVHKLEGALKKKRYLH
jgi:hypothetical protein